MERQPFFVAEVFTGSEGVGVEETIRGFQLLLVGTTDRLLSTAKEKGGMG